MKDSDQYSLIATLDEQETPKAKHILQESDLGLLTHYSLGGGMIQALATYRHSIVITAGRKRAPQGPIKSYCERLGWSKATYHRKRKVGSVIANNPGLDYHGKSDNEILDGAGLLAASKATKVALPTNSSIFKAEITRLNDRVTELEEALEEEQMRSANLENKLEEALEWVESLQETIYERDQ